MSDYDTDNAEHIERRCDNCSHVLYDNDNRHDEYLCDKCHDKYSCGECHEDLCDIKKTCHDCGAKYCMCDEYSYSIGIYKGIECDHYLCDKCIERKKLDFFMMNGIFYFKGEHCDYEIKCGGRKACNDQKLKN